MSKRLSRSSDAANEDAAASPEQPGADSAPERPSRSARKRKAEALQKLGVRLIGLSSYSGRAKITPGSSATNQRGSDRATRG